MRLAPLLCQISIAVTLPSSLAALQTVVATSQAVYALGETVQIDISTCNTSDSLQAVVMQVRCSPPQLEILDAEGQAIAYSTCDGADGAVHTETWSPGECQHQTILWPQSSGRFNHLADPLGSQVPPGEYRARYRTSYTPQPVDSLPFAIAAAVPALSQSSLALLVSVLAAIGTWLLKRN